MSGASEALNISYKTAWSWLDAMNHAASTPLVQSIQGGTRGGQSKLTPAGEQLLWQYELLCERHQRFMASISEEEVHPIQNVESFLRRLSLRTSARNQWHGKVERIWGDTTQAWVDIMIDGLPMLSSRISRVGVYEMGLTLGAEVITLPKATCVNITRPQEDTPRARKGPINRIQGKLARVTVDEDYVQAILEIAAGRTLTSLVSTHRWQEMSPALNDELIAWFEPDHVILATLQG